MEILVKQAPNSSLHNMHNDDYNRYTTLQKEKSAMVQELETLMRLDGDL